MCVVTGAIMLIGAIALKSMDKIAGRKLPDLHFMAYAN